MRDLLFWLDSRPESRHFHVGLRSDIRAAYSGSGIYAGYLLINGAPKIELTVADIDEHLVDKPGFAKSPLAPFQCPLGRRPGPHAPAANRLTRKS